MSKKQDRTRSLLIADALISLINVIHEHPEAMDEINDPKRGHQVIGRVLAARHSYQRRVYRRPKRSA